MNVITLKPHRYKNEQKFIGDKYDFVGRAERRLAIALGWVERTFDDGKIVEVTEVEVLPVNVEQEPVKVDTVEVDPVEVAEVEAAPVEVEEDHAETTIHLKPRKTYKRRDMVAEE